MLATLKRVKWETVNDVKLLLDTAEGLLRNDFFLLHNYVYIYIYMTLKVSF